MSLTGRTVLFCEDLSHLEIQLIFETARRFQKQGFVDVKRKLPSGRSTALLFFEPSTRTRFSFEIAMQKLGLPFSTLSGGGTSLEKGETLLDSFLNVQSFSPDLMIVRFGEDPTLLHALKTSRIPVLSAGHGKLSHPTQALLDLFTIEQYFPSLEGLKILIVGDVVHSRVASSNIPLLLRFGAEIALCGPESWLPKDPFPPGVARIAKLEEGLKWCDIYMGLRAQKERHSETHIEPSAFQLNAQALSKLSKDAKIMHPGPISWGEEFSVEVRSDPREVVLQQAANGVYVRAALLSHVLGLEEKH